jgi:hypothetical protein
MHLIDPLPDGTLMAVARHTIGGGPNARKRDVWMKRPGGLWHRVGYVHAEAKIAAGTARPGMGWASGERRRFYTANPIWPGRGSLGTRFETQRDAVLAIAADALGVEYNRGF